MCRVEMCNEETELQRSKEHFLCVAVTLMEPVG